MDQLEEALNFGKGHRFFPSVKCVFHFFNGDHLICFFVLSLEDLTEWAVTYEFDECILFFYHLK